MSQIKPGQLRRWAHTGQASAFASEKWGAKVFLVIRETSLLASEANSSKPWEFMMNGEVDWHYDYYIVKHSELISESD